MSPEHSIRAVMWPCAMSRSSQVPATVVTDRRPSVRGAGAACDVDFRAGTAAAAAAVEAEAGVSDWREKAWAR